MLTSRFSSLIKIGACLIMFNHACVREKTFDIYYCTSVYWVHLSNTTVFGFKFIICTISWIQECCFHNATSKVISVYLVWRSLTHFSRFSFLCSLYWFTLRLTIFCFFFLWKQESWLLLTIWNLNQADIFCWHC